MKKISLALLTLAWTLTVPCFAEQDSTQPWVKYRFALNLDESNAETLGIFNHMDIEGINLKMIFSEKSRTRGGRRLIRMKWDCTAPADQYTQDQMREIVLDRMRQEVQNAHRENLEHLQDLLRQAEMNKHMAEQKLRELRELERQLFEQAGQMDLSRRNVTKQYMDVQKNIEELEIGYAEMEARRHALAEQIARQADRVRQRIDEDHVADQMRQMIERLEEQLHELGDRLRGQESRTEMHNTSTLDQITSARFDEVELDDALEHLQKQAGVNMVVLWPQLAELGIEHETPITLELKDVPLRQILQYLLAYVSSNAPARIGFTLDESGIILIRAHDPEQEEQLHELIHETQEELLEAREDMVEYMTDLHEKAGGDRLEDWNNQLIDVEMETATLMHEMEFWHNKLNEMNERDLLTLADRYEREVQMKIEDAHKSYRDAENRARDLRSQLEQIPEPALEVLE